MGWGEPVLTEEQRQDAAHYTGLLRQVIAGRPWIVAADVMVAASAIADVLEQHGAAGVLQLAVTEGTGTWDRARRHAFLPDRTGGGATDMVAGIRAFDDSLADPGPEAEAAMDAFDPDGRALVLAGFISSVAEVGRRAVLGPRLPTWLALEDKLTIDALWDEIGVPRAPSRNVPIDDREALIRASSEIDLGDGSVWVADNSTGWHGGGIHARIVAGPGDVDEVAAELRSVAREVRVMPFLEGIPCSIHGFVVGGATAVFRPCEMIVFRDRATRRFVYGQAATTWDPSPEVREAMRAVARRVGDHLRDAVDYRGAFTVDGVVTRDGFRPTELNSRFGGALLKLANAAGLPMIALHTIAKSHPELDWQPDRLERLVVGVADANRSAGSGTVVPGTIAATETVHLAWDGDAFRVVDEDDPDANGTVQIGPTASGRFVLALFDPAIVPAGRSAAPYARDALRVADERWDLGLPNLECAVDVQRP